MKQIKKGLYILGVILGSVGLIFVGTFVAMILLMAAEEIGFAMSEELLYHVSGGLGTVIAAFIVVFHVRRKKYHQCVEPAQKLQIGEAFLVMILSVCLCHILWSGITGPLLAQLLPQQDQAISVALSMNFVNVIFTVLVAPIGEELLFRMGIFCLLLRKLQRRAAIVLCALGFAVAHGYQLEGFLSCLVAGLFFTILYDKTGNIGYSILAHMACNISTTITNALERAGVTWFGLPVQYELNGYNMYHVGLIILAAVFCGVYFIKSIRQKKENEYVSDFGSR